MASFFPSDKSLKKSAALNVFFLFVTMFYTGNCFLPERLE